MDRDLYDNKPWSTQNERKIHQFNTYIIENNKKEQNNNGANINKLVTIFKDVWGCLLNR
tara:strand:- start:504 stop:680 length:177 start_codon:yes stop_codon:yes gene_type:complete